MPFSDSKYPNPLLAYDCKPLDLADGNSYDPEFPFEFGLGYTMFGYSDFALKSDVVTLTDTIVAKVSVKNVGSVAGREVVQVCVSDQYRSVTPPVRELKGFRKISLRRGESTTAEFRLLSGEPPFIGTENRGIVEKRKFRVAVGGQTRDFELRCSITALIKPNTFGGMNA